MPVNMETIFLIGTGVFIEHNMTTPFRKCKSGSVGEEAGFGWRHPRNYGKGVCDAVNVGPGSGFVHGVHGGSVL